MSTARGSKGPTSTQAQTPADPTVPTSDLEAVEDFTRAVSARVGAGDGRRLELGDLLEALEDRVEHRLPMVLVQAHALTRTYDAMAAQTTSMAAAYTVRQALEQVLATADREVVDVDPAALVRARQIVADLEAAQTQTGTDLEAAVLAGDVDAVLQLGTQVEVVIPNRLAQARVAAANEELRLVDSAMPGPDRRCVAAHQSVEAAQEKITDAVAAVAQAEEAARVASVWEILADGSRRLLQSEVDRLTATRERLTGEAEHGHAARLRRLAGLPDEPTVQVSTSTPVLSRTAAVFTSVEVLDESTQRFAAHERLNQVEGLS